MPLGELTCLNFTEERNDELQGNSLLGNPTDLHCSVSCRVRPRDHHACDRTANADNCVDPASDHAHLYPNNTGIRNNPAHREILHGGFGRSDHG
jgi:hypothetical protein